jgi:hypothetical protein
MQLAPLHHNMFMRPMSGFPPMLTRTRVIFTLSILQFLPSSQLMSQKVEAARVFQQTTIGSSPDHPLLGVFGIAFLTGGRLLIADKVEYKVKCFDRSARWITSFGSRGNQDGQFRAPGPISASSKRIAVADFASTRVQLFSTEFNHIATLITEKPVCDLRFDLQGNLWVGQLPDDDGGVLLKFDPSGVLLKTAVTPHPSRDEFDNVFAMTVLTNGRLVLAYMSRNVIDIWDTSGRCDTSLQVPGFPSRSNRVAISRGLFAEDISVPEENIFRGVAADALNRIYLLAGGYTDQPDRDIYVIDTLGRLAMQLVLPREAKGIAMNPRGDLLAIEDDRTLVTSYRVGR